jgi:hypothetical protein
VESGGAASTQFTSTEACRPGERRTCPPPPPPLCHRRNGGRKEVPAAFEAPLPRGLATQTPRPDRVWPNANWPRSAGGNRPSGADMKRVAEQRHRHEARGRCSHDRLDTYYEIRTVLPLQILVAAELYLAIM